ARRTRAARRASSASGEVPSSSSRRRTSRSSRASTTSRLFAEASDCIVGHGLRESRFPLVLNVSRSFPVGLWRFLSRGGSPRCLRTFPGRSARRGGNPVVTFPDDKIVDMQGGPVGVTRGSRRLLAWHRVDNQPSPNRGSFLTPRVVVVSPSGVRPYVSAIRSLQ